MLLSKLTENESGTSLLIDESFHYLNYFKRHKQSNTFLCLM